jgi:hypothetical protein
MGPDHRTWQSLVPESQSEVGSAARWRNGRANLSRRFSAGVVRRRIERSVTS